MRATPRLLGDLDPPFDSADRRRRSATLRADGGLAAALGVTRIARLTGLDRTGVEVASAVRPDGHVLQVTNGKGATFAEAARGALGEAAELWAAERPAELAFERARAAEVRARVSPDVRVLAGVGGGAGDDPGGPSDPEKELRRGWRFARALDDGGPALVPADAVHCPAGTAAAPPSWSRWTSNGMGAHPRRAAAVLHALLEAIERDRLARALPEGFTEGEIASRLLDPVTLAQAAPRTAALRDALVARGFRVHLLDVTGSDFSVRPDRSGRGDGGGGLCPPTARGRSPSNRCRANGDGPPAPTSLSLALPVAAAVILDEDGGPVPVAAGYACRLSRDGALTAALLEAVQSRATEIHGAREDVAFGDRTAALPLAALLSAARPRRSASALPEVRAASPEAAVRELTRRLGRAGFDPGAVADLEAPAGMHVVKVLVPGLLVSELLL